MDKRLAGLEELTKKYVQGLPQRLKDIKSQWQQLKHVNWDHKILSQLHESAHKLTGSGAVYGFSQISTVARTLETQLKQIEEQGRANSAQRTQVNVAIEDLETAINLATKLSGTPRAPELADENSWAIKQSTDKTVHLAVIDDDEDQSSFLVAWLDSQGITASAFSHPKEYLQANRQKSFDLVLMDICYPEGTLEGLIWLENLQSQLDSHTPVIMISARTDMVARMRSLRAGAAAFFTKPLDLDALKARIGDLTERAKTERPRVLWVDDDQASLEVYRRVLTAEGFDVETETQPLALMQRLELRQPDVIILDYMMPGCNGLEIARVLRQDPRYLLVPIVFLSASPQALQNRSQLSLVGNAFLTKPIDQQTLVDCLKQQLTQSQLVAHRMRQISKRFSRDTLTHQHAFFARLEGLLGQLANENSTVSYALMQLEMDQEEYLRATEGLRAVLDTCASIEHVLAGPEYWQDAGCSLGGAAFLGLIAAPTTAQLKERADTLFEKLRQQEWSSAPVNNFTLSSGVVLVDEALSLDELLKRAEAACAQALEAGGNRLKWHDDSRPSEGNSSTDLLKALEDRAFKLLYQPVVNLETGDCLFESILHLEDKKGKLYPPAAFMQWIDDDAELTPNELDRWTLQQAISRLETLAGATGETASVIIPIQSSSAQVHRLTPLIGNIISNTRIKGDRRIFLKFRDDQLLEDVATYAKTLAKLSALSCSVILEESRHARHFSALIKDVGHIALVRLSPRKLTTPDEKNDLQSFMNDCKSTSHENIHFIATDVETASDVAAYWELGIRYFQGFFVQEPGVDMSYNS